MALTQSQIQRIMMLRGFGYQESDIANDLKVSRKTVSNHLQRLKVHARELLDSNMSVDVVYFKLFGFPDIKVKV